MSRRKGWRTVLNPARMFTGHGVCLTFAGRKNRLEDESLGLQFRGSAVLKSFYLFKWSTILGESDME